MIRFIATENYIVGKVSGTGDQFFDSGRLKWKINTITMITAIQNKVKKEVWRGGEWKGKRMGRRKKRKEKLDRKRGRET